MSNGIHSIWLMPHSADEAFLSGLVAGLSQRFGAPLFTPHLTIRGDADEAPASLAAGIAAAAAEVAAFSEAIASVETSAAFFQSFYARLPVCAPLAALKRRLDPEKAESFMPHVSLLYGSVAPAAKAAAAEEVQRLLAGRRIAFDRLCLVRSGQDIPIADWAIIATEPLAPA